MVGDFGSAREAKEFLITQIVEEARREGMPLSEIEREELSPKPAGHCPTSVIWNPRIAKHLAYTL
jgi:hypothetical protein